MQITIRFQNIDKLFVYRYIDKLKYYINTLTEHAFKNLRLTHFNIFLDLNNFKRVRNFI